MFNIQIFYLPVCCKFMRCPARHFLIFSQISHMFLFVSTTFTSIALCIEYVGIEYVGMSIAVLVQCWQVKASIDSLLTVFTSQNQLTQSRDNDLSLVQLRTFMGWDQHQQKQLIGPWLFLVYTTVWMVFCQGKKTSQL